MEDEFEPSHPTIDEENYEDEEFKSEWVRDD